MSPRIKTEIIHHSIGNFPEQVSFEFSIPKCTHPELLTNMIQVHCMKDKHGIRQTMNSITRKNMIKKRKYREIQALLNKARGDFPECASDKQTHATFEQSNCKCQLHTTHFGKIFAITVYSQAVTRRFKSLLHARQYIISPSTLNGHLHLMGICCLLYTSPSPRDRTRSRMPSSA